MTETYLKSFLSETKWHVDVFLTGEVAAGTLPPRAAASYSSTVVLVALFLLIVPGIK